MLNSDMSIQELHDLIIGLNARITQRWRVFNETINQDNDYCKVIENYKNIKSISKFRPIELTGTFVFNIGIVNNLQDSMLDFVFDETANEDLVSVLSKEEFETTKNAIDLLIKENADLIEKIAKRYGVKRQDIYRKISDDIKDNNN